MGPVVESGRVLAARYRLVERLGRGGFGEVWRAEDTVLRRDVAVKTLTLLPADEMTARRFEREARALARLDHPNVVAVYDSGTDDGTGYLVMQLLSGPSLAHLVAERGPLPIAEALGYASQAAAGLAAAHLAGLVHRDVSPSNLMLDGSGVLKLVDFGLARISDVTVGLTATGTVFATPGYVSPEQAAGKRADARSDLYALGCVLFALIAGEPPFTAEHPIGVVQQHLTSPPPRLGERRADVPAGLDRLLGDLLAKDPNDRPSDAAEVERRLGELRSAGGETAVTVALPRPMRRRRRTVALWLLAAGALVALGAILAGALTGNDRTTPPPALVSSAQKTAAPTTSRATTTAAKTTTTAPTTTHEAAVPPPPTVQSPGQAIAALHAAIVGAESRGQLDPKAGDDLAHHLDDITKALAHPNPKDAGKKVADLQHRLDDLAHKGKVSGASYAAIAAALSRLAALVPAGE